MLKLTRWVIASMCVMSAAAYGQAAKAPDPFDLSEARELAKATGGLPTIASVDALGVETYKLFDAGNCEAAQPQLERYAIQANLIGHILSSGLQPFYGASFDDKKGFNAAYLAPFETRANEYARRRNEAMVMQAECLQKAGKKEEAAAHYLRALKIIDIEHSLTWERARKGLYELIGAN